MPIRHRPRLESWARTYGQTYDYSRPVPESSTLAPPPPSRGSTIRVTPTVTISTATVVNPQKFVVRGTRSISYTGGGTQAQAVIDSVIKEMIDNLEGYLYVTAPVLRWEGEHGGPVIHQGQNFSADTYFLKIEGVGYLDAESSGEDEIIEV